MPAKSAKVDFKSKAKSAAKSKTAKVKSAAKSKTAKVKSAAKTDAPTARIPIPAEAPTARIPAPGTVPTARSAAADIPLGEALDLTPPFIGANIYDEAIGYGTALPGEAGSLAVERIKAERVSRRASRVNR